MYPLGKRPALEAPYGDLETELKSFKEQIERSYVVPPSIDLKIITPNPEDKPEVFATSHSTPQLLAQWFDDYQKAPPQTWDPISKAKLGKIMTWDTLSEFIRRIPSYRNQNIVLVEVNDRLYTVKADIPNGVIRLVVE